MYYSTFYRRIYMCVCVCMYLCMYVYMYVCMYVFVCMYVPMYVCMLGAPQSRFERVRSRATLLPPPLPGFEPWTLFVTSAQMTTLCPKLCRLEVQKCDQIQWFADKRF